MVDGTEQAKAFGERDATETALEQQIQAKGLNAPRLTPALIDATITAEAYHLFPGTTLTVCALTLRNGFIVTGTSAAASPENFDEAIGRDIARRNARERIWELEGYLLRQRLHQAAPMRFEGANCVALAEPPAA